MVRVKAARLRPSGESGLGLPSRAREVSGAAIPTGPGTGQSAKAELGVIWMISDPATETGTVCAVR
jgi:hypothetical protein